jgi:hypothetical protein
VDTIPNRRVVDLNYWYVYLANKIPQPCKPSFTCNPRPAHHCFIQSLQKREAALLLVVDSWNYDKHTCVTVHQHQRTARSEEQVHVALTVAGAVNGLSLLGKVMHASVSQHMARKIVFTCTAEALSLLMLSFLSRGVEADPGMHACINAFKCSSVCCKCTCSRGANSTMRALTDARCRALETC